MDGHICIYTEDRLCMFVRIRDYWMKGTTIYTFSTSSSTPRLFGSLTLISIDRASRLEMGRYTS